MAMQMRPPEARPAEQQQDAPMTLGDVAIRFGVRSWQVRSLYQRGLLPPAPRMGTFRVVMSADLPAVEAALKLAGHLDESGNPTPRRGPGYYRRTQPIALE